MLEIDFSHIVCMTDPLPVLDLLLMRSFLFSIFRYGIFVSHMLIVKLTLVWMGFGSCRLFCMFFLASFLFIPL